MCDAVIISYHLFFNYENLVQKHKKNGNAVFFLWFFENVWEMSGHFPIKVYA